MEATISKWGNGAGLLIPKSVRDEAGIEIGDRVTFGTAKDGFTVTKCEPLWNLHDLMDGYDGPKPEFIDPGEPAGREVW